ncbi:hypothetical protein HYDPIDRAFT_152514 [Hydnomerulius pinastri MD-312]|nr:hypothetical protein HYDPIDRAFT_152514 [Hydnomerulius pinastri MD-312]
MAFPIPSHLPRKVDVSSQILSKLDSVTFQTLNSSVASSWRTELDESISLTKKRIHDRIHADLPAFEGQLASAKSAQERLHTLASDMDVLDRAVSNQETGLTPVLLEALRRHQALAQASLNADVLHASLLHLSNCKAQLDSVQTLVDNGNLPAAVPACAQLTQLLGSAPSPLNRAAVTVDMKAKLRALANRVEELLSSAYSQSVVVSPTEIIIRPSVLVPNAQNPIPLSSVLSSLSASALFAHLTSLRRDLTTHYIDYSLQHTASLTAVTESDQSGLTVHRLQRLPPIPTSPDSASLDNLSRVLDFINDKFFPSLPQSQKDSFPRSLAKPLTTSIMSGLLILSLPSKVQALPAFLELCHRAVDFETKYVVGLLGGDAFEREIKSWVDNVCAHYERGRRLRILDDARTTILASATRKKETFFAELVVAPEPVRPSLAVETAPSSEPDAWGLEDDQRFKPGSANSAVDASDGWGFDDEVAESEESPATKPDVVLEPEPDPSDAWGWNDDEPVEEDVESANQETADPAPDNSAEEEDVWDDDPWADDSAVNDVTLPDRPLAAPTVSPPSVPAPSAPSSASQKRQQNGHQHTNGHITNGVPQSSNGPQDTSIVGREPYPVSIFTKDVVQAVENALHEGKAFASSGIFPPTSTPLPGTLIMQSGALVLDLYRALYPVVAASQLARPADHMQLSNDLYYLAEEIKRVTTHQCGELIIKDKLEECKEDLRVLAESWFHVGVEKQVSALGDVLAGADGFTDTSDQERYDECEMAITQALRDVRNVAHAWKPILPKSKYYVAVGTVVDGVLSRILDDILAIPDIPEVESHKLSELCRILSALEGLFVGDMNENSFVVSYVPSWLKFSYLSELLEASMADLTYLFEEGALVDFEIDELVKLVRALFADTPLRTKTLDKIMVGHPTR